MSFILCVLSAACIVQSAFAAATLFRVGPGERAHAAALAVVGLVGGAVLLVAAWRVQGR